MPVPVPVLMRTFACLSLNQMPNCIYNEKQQCRMNSSKQKPVTDKGHSHTMQHCTKLVQGCRARARALAGIVSWQVCSM